MSCAASGSRLTTGSSAGMPLCQRPRDHHALRWAAGQRAGALPRQMQQTHLAQMVPRRRQLVDRRPPADFQSGPNDDPADENVALDEDENLPWPDPERIGQWWTANRSRFSVGTPYFLGAPKATADWLEALSDAFQRQRHAAALELAIRQPNKAMFEVRARGRLQRQLLARARGSA